MENDISRVANALPGLVWTALPDGQIDFLNHRWCEYTGLSLDEGCGHAWRTAIHPEDLPKLVDCWRSIVSSGEPGEMEARLRRFDGEYRWFLMSSSPMRNEAGQIVKWHGLNTDIEDRTRAEEALRLHELSLNLIVESIPVPIAVTTPSGEVEALNRPTLEYFGETFQELKGWKTSDVVHPDDLQHTIAAQRQAHATGHAYSVQSRHRRADGIYGWFTVLGFPLRDTQGRILRWFHLLIDIDDRKRAEEQLRRSEAYLAEAQKLSHTGSFGWNVRSGEIHWSRETFRIFECEPTAKTSIELILQRTHPEDRSAVQQLIDRVSRERTEFDFEHRLLMPDGSVKYLRVVGTPSQNEDGCFEFVGAVTDFTERKRVEAALRRSGEELTIHKAQLDELFEQAPEGIVLLDVEDRVLRINPEFTQIFGYTPDEAIGRSINDLIAPEEIRGEAEEYTHRIIHGKPVNAETIRRRKDGQRIHVSQLYFPISVPASIVGVPTSTAGSQLGEYAIYRDITERTRAEEALRRSEGCLAEAQRITRTGSWAWNLAARHAVYWSQEHYRVFGFDPEGGIPSDEAFHQRVHPEDRDRVQRAVYVGREGEGSIFNVEYRILLPDGAIKYIRSTGHPVFNASGDVVEYFGAAVDVTEQHEARAALETAFEQIKALKDQLYNENIVLREEIDRSSMFEEIVGTSPALKTVLSRVSKVASTDSTVLITGDTGTGKELVARAIHRRSQRSSHAFVSVNCAAIPRDLIASELFGHEKGAFTGATQRRIGRFELAGGGTIFLDEVGDLPAETQVALLRVLQEHEFDRVGGNRPIQTDVRLIAATNRDLQAAMAAGTFRSDLFYRLNVFPIEIPPLRQRREDIPLLAEYFINRYSRKAGKSIRGVNKKTLDLLQSYPWPGNIRELQNIIERSVIVCETETFSIDESWLPQQRQPFLAAKAKNQIELARRLEEQEKDIIEEALIASRGRVFGPTGAAAKLGIARSTLESKIRTLKIDKNRFKADPEG
jgi:PAS domain S-box-containing protein